MGAATRIESFPARSEACQKSCKGPQEPLENLVCRKRKEQGAKGAAEGVGAGAGGDSPSFLSSPEKQRNNANVAR